MTLDERIEALVQSVELMAGMQRDNDRAAAERDHAVEQRIEALVQSVELMAGMQRDSDRAATERDRAAEERSARLDKRMAEIMESINTLGRIAGLHEDRLDEHEQRLDDLESH